jgi:hypothetical protein
MRQVVLSEGSCSATTWASTITTVFGVLFLVEDPELANRLKAWQKRRKISQDRLDQLA